MKEKFTGTAWTFRDNINTESIMNSTNETAAKIDTSTCLAYYDPEFPKGCKPGDVIVAGKNFGNSSSRPAALILKAMGLGAIICESSARIFYRNTWNIGIPVLECPGITELVEKGDKLEVDVEAGKVKNLTNGREAQCEPPIDLLLDRWRAGGMIEWIKRHPELYPTVTRFNPPAE